MREAVSALDDQLNETLNRAFDTLRQQLETTLGACREEVSRVASEEAARAAVDAAKAATHEVKRDAERQLTEWRETAAREAEERERDSDARVRQAEAREHDAEAREREADAQRLEVEAKLQASERIVEELRRSLDEARQDIDEARRSMDEARLRGEQDVEEARQEAEQFRRQLDQWLQDVEGFKQEVRGFQEALAEATVQAARLPEAIRLLDQAGSLGEALDALVRCAVREVQRSAVFLVKGDRLHDWRLVGFDQASQQRIEIPTDGPGLFGDAVRGVRGVKRGKDLPAFAAGSGPRHAVTMPVRVGGAVVAVLYADTPEADNQSEPVWPERLDMLARYAGRMLELITIRQAAGLAGIRPVKTAAVSASGHPPAGSVL
jgi:hypothetical protein